jgi:deoxyguanosine kinase
VKISVPYKYIAIEGCIGAGKTELAKLIAARLNSRLLLEQFEDNPFLPKFYEDRKRYAFALEMSFLASRFHQLSKDLQNGNLFKEHIVADYIIQKCLLFSRITLDDEEYNLYNRFFQIVKLNVPPPELLVYIYRNPEHLMRNIIKRNRDYEKSIDAAYLSSIQDGYLEMFRNSPGLRVLLLDAHQFDFLESETNFDIIFRLLAKKYPVGVNRVTL